MDNPQSRQSANMDKLLQLMPDESDRLRGEMMDRLELAESMSSSPRCRVQISDDTDRPDLMVFDDDRGIVFLEIVGDEENPDAASKRLNRKIAALREDVDELDQVPIIRVLIIDGIVPVAPSGSTTHRVSADELGLGNYISNLEASNVDPEMVEVLWRRLNLSMTFSVKARTATQDHASRDRNTLRLVLDSEQADLAMSDVDDVSVISGPAGSGKTLVLVARSRWLSSKHPDWKILLLCYNRELAMKLTVLVGELSNVRVNSFHAFAKEQGHVFWKSDDESASIALSAIRKQGLTPSFDAIIVDEWQDFSSPWIEYLLDQLRPGHGGLMLAGDTKQAIYRENAPDAALSGRKIHRNELFRPYRSTRQILEFTKSLDPAFLTVGMDLAPEGPAVDLIRADDWNSQARVAAWEVAQMIRQGIREPRDIGIICTRKSLIGRLEKELIRHDIPFRVAGEDVGDSEQSNRVTLATVHAQKGLEFDAVVLVGLDAIKSLDEVDVPQKARIGYVGPTRARDHLTVTFTKPTTFVKRLRDCPPGTLIEWVYPDSYPEEANG